MNVRITRPASGVIDGVSLSSLIPGLTYDLPDSLATLLVNQRVAVEVDPQQRGTVTPLDGIVDHIAGGIVVSRTNPPAIAIAHDRPRKKRRKPRR